MSEDKPPLPKRAPYKAHDKELDIANEQGIRPATDAESDPGRRSSRLLRRGRREEG